MVYGQTEITRDLYEAREAAGTTIPPELRQPGKIIYYTNIDFPDYDEDNLNSIYYTEPLNV